MDWSPPGSSVHGISQARILEQVASSFSRGSPPNQIVNTSQFAYEGTDYVITSMGGFTDHHSSLGCEAVSTFSNFAEEKTQAEFCL